MTNLYCRATVNLVIESAEENPLSGPNKSLKNSLRESFNKIRSDPSDLIFCQLWVFPRRSHTARVHQKKRLHYCDTQPLIIPEHDVPDSCLPERRVIAEDGSLVRSLHFSCTFIENTTSTSPTLWVGTNSGLILVLSLAIPELFEDRQSDGILAVLAKEIQLQHKAPVVGIEVLDAKGSNLTANSEVSCQSLLAYMYCMTRPCYSRPSEVSPTKCWSAQRNSSSCSPCLAWQPAGSIKLQQMKAWSSAELKQRLFPAWR